MLQGVAMGIELTLAKSIDHPALPLKTTRRSRAGIARREGFTRWSDPGPLLYILSGMISYPWARLQLRNAVGQPLCHNQRRAATPLEDIATVCTVYYRMYGV